MSDNLPIISVEGLELTIDAETEAHGLKAGHGPAEAEAHAGPGHFRTGTAGHAPYSAAHRGVVEFDVAVDGIA